MELQFSEVGGVTKATLEGRLDTLGVGQIETRFVSAVVPKSLPTVVDLSGVSFIASLGIRMLLSTARALSREGSKLAVYGAQAQVMEIIETTAISEIIPVLETESEALAAVAA